eukprot:gene32283-2354_t
MEIDEAPRKKKKRGHAAPLAHEQHAAASAAGAADVPAAPLQQLLQDPGAVPAEARGGERHGATPSSSQQTTARPRPPRR